MRFADVREQADRRLGNPRDRVDLAEMVGAELHDRDLVRFVDLQNRRRHAGLVVQIADGRVGTKRRFEDRPDHFLRRRLADAAGDAHDRQVKPLAVQLCGVLIGAHGILHAAPIQHCKQPSGHQQKNRQHLFYLERY